MPEKRPTILLTISNYLPDLSTRRSCINKHLHSPLEYIVTYTCLDPKQPWLSAKFVDRKCGKKLRPE